MEGKKNNEKIFCTTIGYSSLWEGNICDININEKLSKIYSDIFDLGITYRRSYNNKVGNLSAKDCPFLLYGNVRIEGGNFNSFFKRLTNINSKLEDDDYVVNDVNLSPYDFLYFEKMILIDLQAQINLNSYLKFYKRLNIFWRFLRFIVQPVRFFFTMIKDSHNMNFITKHFDITDKKEVII